MKIVVKWFGLMPIVCEGGPWILLGRAGGPGTLLGRAWMMERASFSWFTYTQDSI